MKFLITFISRLAKTACRELLLKRPLCLAALLLFPLSAYRYPKIRYMPAGEGTKISLTGVVAQKEGSLESPQIRLKNISICETSAPADVSFLYESARSQKSYAYDVLLSLKEPSDADDLNIGDILFVIGDVRDFEHPSNPGQFDTALYQHNRKTGCRIVKARAEVLGKKRGLFVLTGKIQSFLGNSFSHVLPKNAAAVLTAVTLGDRSKLSGEIKTLFSDGGIGHILAVSGLHISLVGMSLYRLLRKRRFPIAPCAAVSAGFLFIYCMMTGFPVSAVRAFVLFAFYLGAQLTGRKPDTLISLSAACIILLIRRPGLVFDGGFYLSFGCVLSLSFLTGPVEKSLRTLIPLPLLPRGLSSSLAVFIGTAPVCCLFYYQLTPWAILANLVVLPFMAFLFLFGLAGSTLGLILPSAGRFLAAPCHYLVTLFLVVCRAERYLPFSVWITGRPALWQAAAFYLLVIFRIRKKRLRFPFRVLLLPASLMILTFRFPVSFRLAAIDVGQGDCILLQTEGHSFLTDCGSGSLENVWDSRVSGCLKYYGIRHLDGIFATHSDLDHVNGIKQLLGDYQKNLTGENAGDVTVNCLFLPEAVLDKGLDSELEKLKESAEKKGIPVVLMGKGDTITPGKKSVITCLYPGEEDIKTEGNDENQMSLVLMAHVGKIRIFLTGDLEKEGEERFVQNCKALQDELWEEDELTILKAGHHGSRYATSDVLLDLIRPDLAMISCGKNNRYGHPAEEVLLRLSMHGVKILRTDLEGALIIESF